MQVSGKCSIQVEAVHKERRYSPTRRASRVIPFVVLVTGLPAAGKTTLSRPLAGALSLPTLRLDSIKEAMFDSVGYGTRAWSDLLTIAGNEIAFRTLPEIGPCVFDVFMPQAEAHERLPPLVSEIIEIHCSIPYDRAWERFVARARSGQRHPGHVDADVSLDFYINSLTPQGVDIPFGLGGPLLVVDTTTDVDMRQVCDWASRQVARVANSA
jgi:predicted kinase